MAAAPTSSCHPTPGGHLLSPSVRSANPRCLLALLLAGAGLYLERLQEASVTPILQLVLLGPQPQHGLRVPVQLVVQVVQQGSPCAVLGRGRAQPGPGRSSGTDPRPQPVLSRGQPPMGTTLSSP